MNSNRTNPTRYARMRVMRTLTVLSGIVLLTGLALRSLLRKTNRHSLEKQIEKGVQAGRDAVEPMVKHLGGQFSDLRETVEERVKQ